MTTLLTPQAEQLVNTTTLDDQTAPCIVKLASGYVVVWQSLQAPGAAVNQHFPPGYDIHMQRFSDAGVALGGEVQVNSIAFNDQVQPTVVALADGGFAVAWASAREQAVQNFDYGVYLQRFDAAGAWVGSETHVNDFYALDQDRPSIAALSGGGMVVTWTSDTQSPNPPGVYAKLFGADGKPIGNDLRVDTSTSGIHAGSAAAGLADGGYVIVWDGNGDIHAQRFDAHGTAQAAPALVNSTVADVQSDPAVTALADGGYVVTWSSLGQDGNDSGVFLQRYGASGAAVGAELQVNTVTAGSQGSPSLTALADGGFVVAWQSSGEDGSGSGIYAQRYDASGHALGTETQLNSSTFSDQSAPAIAATGDGGFVAAWMSYQQDGSGWGIYSKSFTGTQPLRLNSERVDSFVHGTAGLDTAVIASDTAGVLGCFMSDGVLSLTTAQGTQHIDNVERIQFSNALFALDTQGPSGGDAPGHVWEAAMLIHAGFGLAPGRAMLSQWTAQADHSSSMGELGQKILDFYAPGLAAPALVALVFHNLTGISADAATAQNLAGKIGAGQPFATEGDFLAAAASLSLNTEPMVSVVGSVQQLDAAWF
ncbi:MAG TPA: hypothetical protein VNS31_01675 [Ramlibacter sp.]|nr:hypothetical protein [Ramlibacter sp.]